MVDNVVGDVMTMTDGQGFLIKASQGRGASPTHVLRFQNDGGSRGGPSEDDRGFEACCRRQAHRHWHLTSPKWVEHRFINQMGGHAAMFS